MRKRMFVAIYLFILVLAVSSFGMAQTTATLSGVVTDETAAVLAGAQMTVTNTATGVARSLTTDSAGRFVVSELPPGPYEVTATMTGFETLLRRGITLTIGQEARLSLMMKVGVVSEQLTVTGEAPMVNTSNSSVSGVVEEKRIQDLPLNGRDFSQLPLVQPGVSAVRTGDQTITKGYGTRVSMGGSRPDQTAWLLDGTSIKNLSNFGTPGGAAGLMLGVDAVREFQVLTSDYSAELGGTSGGVVNMLTKSGTNRLHGSAFEFLRNSALDARNFFDPEKPPFKRNQFGGSLGGSIKKDKTFFFGSYEGLRQRLGVTTVATVPDVNAHQGFIPTPGGGLQPVVVAPEIRPYLNLWPLPNGPELGGGIATLFGSGNNPVGENYVMARVDHHINDRQSIFARFTFDQGSTSSPDTVPITETQVGVRSRYTTVQHDYVVSPQFLMSTRIAYNRSVLLSNEIPLISYPASLNLLLPGYLPQFTVPGASTFGPNASNWINRAQNLYNVEENLQYIHGGHSMKFGGLIEHVGTNKNNELSGWEGAFTWSSLQDFLADNRLSGFAGVAQGSDPARSWVQYVYALYFQDDWKMRSNFTWNFGVRYEPFTAPTEKYGRMASLGDWRTATAFQTNLPLFNSPAKKNVSPRVGFAWDPKGDGKTAVRAGFGLFFVDILGPYYSVPGQRIQPFLGATSSVLGNLASAVSDLARISPSLLVPTTSPNSLADFIQLNPNPSYEMKFNFALERQLPGDLSVSIGYLGDRGIHLWRTTDLNTVPPIVVNSRLLVVAGAPRVNPNLGGGTVRYSDAQSFYNAMQVEVKKRFSHGLQFQSSYTFSKNVDDGTTAVGQTDFTPGGNGDTSVGAYYPKAIRGLSSLNLSQILVINGIYALPSPAHSGFSSTLLGGWQVASIFTANSGAPFSGLVSGRIAPDGSRFVGVQYPDHAAGRSSSSIVSGTSAGCRNPNGTVAVAAGTKLGSPNLYFDPCTFVLPPVPVGYPAGSGFYGNAGRNILIGPGLVNFDFSLQKSTRLGIREGSRLEFHADFFNSLNRANFSIPRAAQSQVLNPATGAYIASAGKITNTITPARQLQFGLKLIF